MCGFVGFTGLREQREAILHRMADRIIHRGPDMEGYHISGDDPRTAIALGFRRLSIIDLAAGKQPMYNEDGTVVCVFNGEIYNFMDLRTELQAKGHIFKTHCDTEVIIHGYEEYGTALAARLRGMFAFVVWDTKTNEMYGARDIFGIKPFYYTQTDAGELLFGSEIKSLLEHPGFRREVNAEALRPYLTFQYSAMNETFFKGTYKLPPAHWFTYRDGKMQIERYWDVDFRHPTTLSYEAAADEIDARVRESVAAHRISDVKLGAFIPAISRQCRFRLRPYLTFQYSAMNETFFKGTYKLPPAHWFTYKDGKMQIERYWDADFRHPTTLSYEQCADQIDARVRESVAAHRISDVKLGAFLSGGVDSSYITACLMPDETFSVGFASPDGTHKFDETTEAGELSQKLGIKNYREMLTKEQCLDAFADIQYHMDEPQSNPSSVPLYFLCQLARQHVTVVLSGEGADEIYAGYEWYADTPLMQKYKHIPAPLRHLASDASQHLPYFKGHDFIIKGSGRPEDWFIGQAHVFEEKDAYDILKPKYRVGPTAREVAAPIYDRVKDLSELEKKQYLDLNLWLPGDILLKADKMSMAHSLELRVPYRFPVPIAKWLEDPAFSAKVRKSFMSDVAAEYFDQDKLVAMLADPKHERRKIWTAYTFLTWHEQFFEKFDA